VTVDRRYLALLRDLLAAEYAYLQEPALVGAGSAPSGAGGACRPGSADLVGWAVPRPVGLLASGRLTPTLAAGTGGGPPGTGAEDGTDDPEQRRMAALLVLAQQGDGEAFGHIYDSYVDQVYRYLYYRVGTHALAEDLTSETFLRALRRIDSFSWQGRDIGAWFVTIARNLVTDHFKSSRFRLEVATADMLDADRADDGIEGEVLERLDNQALLGAVQKLKPEQQECVVLRFLQGLSVAETARVMSRSEGAVKQLQLRAVRALAKLLPEPAV
jgi:RNA polymerase sigma-70 factor (ECF subfamily)